MHNPLVNWMLVNIALLAMIGAGFLEYVFDGRRKKEREEATANKWISQAQDKVKRKRILIMLKNVKRLAKDYDLSVKFAPNIHTLEKEVDQAGAIQENLQTFWDNKAKEIEALTHSLEAENQRVKIGKNKSASLIFSFVGTILFILLSTPDDLIPFSYTKCLFWLFFVVVLFFLLYMLSRLFYARIFIWTLLKLSSFIVYISNFSSLFVVYAVTKLFLFSSVGLSILYYNDLYIYAYKLLFPATTGFIANFPNTFIVVGEFIAILLAYVEASKFLRNIFVKKRGHTK